MDRCDKQWEDNPTTLSCSLSPLKRLRYKNTAQHPDPQPPSWRWHHACSKGSCKCSRGAGTVVIRDEIPVRKPEEDQHQKAKGWKQTNATVAKALQFLVNPGLGPGVSVCARSHNYLLHAGRTPWGLATQTSDRCGWHDPIWTHAGEIRYYEGLVLK